MPDTNPVYGGPYLDQHVPDPLVPQSMPSANVNMPILPTDDTTVPAADLSGVTATATAEQTEANQQASTESDNPDGSPVVPTDSGEHL